MNEIEIGDRITDSRTNSTNSYEVTAIQGDTFEARESFWTTWINRRYARKVDE